MIALLIRAGTFLSTGLIALCVVSPLVSAEAAKEFPMRGAVATVHPLASEAGMRAMESGGNAIDAAVAAGLTLGVVDGFNSGIGGGCFMVIRRSDGSIAVLDGRETAPAAARRDMFVRDGRADVNLSQTGALAIGVPGSLAVYDHALRQFGKLTLRQHLLAAAEVAEKGFTLNQSYVRRLESVAKDLQRFEAARAVFLDKDGSPWGVGAVLRQPDLARSYRALAGEGISWFYSGDFAARIDRWMKSNGGIVTEKDLNEYDFKLREAVRTTYRGYDVIGFPPPSSGGVHVAQILNILEHFNLREMGANSADFVHVVTEAMKLAFADRAFWLGDPDFVPVPRGLIAREYASKLARRIDLRRAMRVPAHETPERATDDVFGKHTTHYSSADSDGNWVACTATVNTTYGSKVVIPGTGIVMNNQMDDFSIQPGVPNAFGLLGAEANAVGPRKRPLSSMSPTIVLKDGKPILAVGAAGGPTIISQTLLAILHVVDFGKSATDALAQPRFHHQWQPDELRVERSLPTGVRAELLKRGHRVVVVESLGAAQAVARDAAGNFSAVADPRGEGLGVAR